MIILTNAGRYDVAIIEGIGSCLLMVILSNIFEQRDAGVL